MLLIVNWKKGAEHKCIVITGGGQRFEGNQSHGSAYDFSGDGRKKKTPCEEERTKSLGEQDNNYFTRICDKMDIWGRAP